MKRRDFLKLSLYAGIGCLLPRVSRAAGPLDDVQFAPDIYAANQPKTIMIFLYGGASELAGNFTNYDDFKDLSQSSYEAYFGSSYLNATANGFWASAGGDIMEQLLAAGDLNVLRTCFSQVRWDNDNRSHGSCVAQNQRGTFNENAAGIFSNLARVLKNNNVINSNTKMPFLTMEGESGFYALGDLQRDSTLQPLSINEDLDNPFHRNREPEYSDQMDTVAQLHNPPGAIKDAFEKRREMEAFINEIENLPDPELGEDEYQNNSFARKLRTAVKIMKYNSDTRVITLGTSGLGGWDDHNDAENYLSRMNGLFLALKSAMAHIALDTDMRNRINLTIMGDFGRGLNLNTAYGWDHGNLQTVYVLGGSDYFNRTTPPGVFGETEVVSTGSVNRLYLKPAQSSYWFEPLSVASTIYAIYGITNPEVLTDGTSVIAPLVG